MAGMVKTLSAALVKHGGRRKRKPIPRRQRGRVSAKIGKLRHEGVPQQKAIATAMSMGRAKRLGPKGGYRRVGR